MREIATFAAGCFWCTEAVFRELKGVEKVEPGYSGGDQQNSYEEVSKGKTGHAEAIQITFDNKIIPFKKLLEVFFTIHDPTTMNRQGPDVGSQYRSVIFYHDEGQRKTALVVVKNVQKLWDKPIVTQIVPFKKFYTAEKYHQNYYKNNPSQPYCIAIIDPKIIKFRKQFAKLRK